MNKEDLGCLTLIAVALVGGTLFAMLFFYVGNQMSLPVSLAKIEQLRADALMVDPQQAEDVIGQVTEWNQYIAMNQALNRTWYAALLVPDEWDHVELITVPKNP